MTDDEKAWCWENGYLMLLATEEHGLQAEGFDAVFLLPERVELRAEADGIPAEEIPDLIRNALEAHGGYIQICKLTYADHH